MEDLFAAARAAWQEWDDSVAFDDTDCVSFVAGFMAASASDGDD